MPFRLLSVFGAFAHFGDAILAPIIKFGRPRQKLVAAGARVSGALVIAVILAGVAIAAVGVGNEGSANTSPTVYTVDQLKGNPELGGKVYATVSGVLDGDYVDTYAHDTYQYSDYLVCDATSPNCLVVVSKMPEAEMAKVASEDGSVTLTGMVRADSKEVADALRTLGTRVSSLNVNSGILLKQGDTPANATLMYGVAALTGIVGLALLIGWAIGFLVFRPAGSRQALSTSGMTGSTPVRVTGLIPGYLNGTRAREMKAELKVPAPNPGVPEQGVAPVDLVWQTKTGITGVRLASGTSQAVMGTAYPAKGARPAIRIKFDKYRLIFTFDTEQARDQAFDQFRGSSGLIASADGASAARAG